MNDCVCNTAASTAFIYNIWGAEENITTMKHQLSLSFLYTSGFLVFPCCSKFSVTLSWASTPPWFQFDCEKCCSSAWQGVCGFGCVLVFLIFHSLLFLLVCLCACVIYQLICFALCERGMCVLFWLSPWRYGADVCAFTLLCSHIAQHLISESLSWELECALADLFVCRPAAARS